MYLRDSVKDCSMADDADLGYDEFRRRLDKLMANPDKPVVLPEARTMKAPTIKDFHREVGGTLLNRRDHAPLTIAQDPLPVPARATFTLTAPFAGKRRRGSTLSSPLPAGYALRFLFASWLIVCAGRGRQRVCQARRRGARQGGEQDGQEPPQALEAEAEAGAEEGRYARGGEHPGDGRAIGVLFKGWRQRGAVGVFYKEC